MTALIMDGKIVAGRIQGQLSVEIDRLVQAGIRPCLAVILVGDNPSSAAYVRHKTAVAQLLGITLELKKMSEAVSQQDVLHEIWQLNAYQEVHGILVQLPLPPHLNKQELLQAVDPRKDVDGLHVANLGKLFNGQRGLVPCTPAAVMAILQHYNVALYGKQAVVLGRSVLVGKPVRELLEARDVTVTTCHSKTPPSVLRRVLESADVVVAAMGRPRSITGEMLGSLATVIDVGITQVDGRLVGDVDFDSAVQVVDYITPVPGGVGPVTVAMLMQNTVTAAREQNTEYCELCKLPAMWKRVTQFSGHHRYCEQHATAQPDFGTEDPSYSFWNKIGNP